MVELNGDLVPASSGLSSLGINSYGTIGEPGLDITTLRPFGRFHVVSGVFHDALAGQSGVLRYNRGASAFQISVDGGLTFANISTGAGGVDSVGVLGGTDLTGDVDFATPTSGFIAITDDGGSSPIFLAVDTLGLSGLWGFPANGFPTTLSRLYAETFAALSSTWTVTHNLGTTDVVVQVYDASSPRRQVIPDKIEQTNTNTVTVTFNSPTGGRVLVIGFQ